MELCKSQTKQGGITPYKLWGFTLRESRELAFWADDCGSFWGPQGSWPLLQSVFIFSSQRYCLNKGQREIEIYCLQVAQHCQQFLSIKWEVAEHINSGRLRELSSLLLSNFSLYCFVLFNSVHQHLQCATVFDWITYMHTHTNMHCGIEHTTPRARDKLGQGFPSRVKHLKGTLPMRGPKQIISHVLKWGRVWGMPQDAACNACIPNVSAWVWDSVSLPAKTPRGGKRPCHPHGPQLVQP